MTYPYGNGDGQQNGWNQGNNGGWQQHGYGGQQPSYDEQQYQSYYGAQPPHMGGYNHGGQMPPKPDTNLVWGILATILCCNLLGIVSIVYATQVDKAWNEGNYPAAVDSSRKAKTWAIVVAILGLLVWGPLGIFWLYFWIAAAGTVSGIYY